MWAKYDLGTATKTNDSKTGKPVTRNIYYQHVDANGNPAADDKPSAMINGNGADLTGIGAGTLLVVCVVGPLSAQWATYYVPKGSGLADIALDTL